MPAVCISFNVKYISSNECGFGKTNYFPTSLQFRNTKLRSIFGEYYKRWDLDLIEQMLFFLSIIDSEKLEGSDRFGAYSQIYLFLRFPFHFAKEAGCACME